MMLSSELSSGVFHYLCDLTIIWVRPGLVSRLGIVIVCHPVSHHQSQIQSLSRSGTDTIRNTIQSREEFDDITNVYVILTALIFSQRQQLSFPNVFSDVVSNKRSRGISNDAKSPQTNSMQLWNWWRSSMEYIFSLHNLLFMGFLQSSLVMLPQKNKTTTSTITNRTLRFVPTKKLNRDKEIICSPKTYYQYISTTMRNDDMMRSSCLNQWF